MQSDSFEVEREELVSYLQVDIMGDVRAYPEFKADSVCHSIDYTIDELNRVLYFRTNIHVLETNTEVKNLFELCKLNMDNFLNSVDEFRKSRSHTTSTKVCEMYDFYVNSLTEYEVKMEASGSFERDW